MIRSGGVSPIPGRRMKTAYELLDTHPKGDGDVIVKYKVKPSKPAEVEAVQIAWKNWSYICELLGDWLKTHPGRISNKCNLAVEEAAPFIEITVPVQAYDQYGGEHEQTNIAYHGDWIVKYSEKQFGVYTDSEFSSCYVAVK